MSKPPTFKGIWLCDACGNIETMEREVHCWKCELGMMIYMTGQAINSELHLIDLVRNERDKAYKQIIEWRDRIRETGHDGALEIVNAYKAKCAEIHALRKTLEENMQSCADSSDERDGPQ